MGCTYKVYDKVDEVFLSVSFAEYEGAEDYVEKELGSNWVRYDIYEKLT